MGTPHVLKCLASGVELEDAGLTLESGGNGRGLLRTVYAQKQLRVGKDADGLYKYASWLPVRRTLFARSVLKQRWRSESLT